MEFEWDESKRRKVLEKHGIDFQLAARVLMAEHVLLPARSDVEPRFLAVGFLDGEWVTVVHTWRGESCRVITARKAREHERRAYRSVYN
jgi:uncharacterized DUF497 family protein